MGGGKSPDIPDPKPNPPMPKPPKDPVLKRTGEEAAQGLRRNITGAGINGGTTSALLRPFITGAKNLLG